MHTLIDHSLAWWQVSSSAFLQAYISHTAPFRATLACTENGLQDGDGEVSHGQARRHLLLTAPVALNSTPLSGEHTWSPYFFIKILGS